MEIRKKIINQLALMDEYLSLVKEGIKTSTVRFGYNFIDDARIKLIGVETREEILVRFEKLEIIKYEELTAEHAIKDGFLSLEELQQALVGFYGNIPNDYPVTIIHFSL